MKFKITSLNIDEIIKTSFFRVDYIIESDKNEVINTRVSIYDPFFNIEYIPGSMDVSVSTNCIYWVGFDVDKLANDEKPNFKFGFRLLIEDLDNNVILHNQVHRTTFEYNKEGKTVWIFGDSHAWESFGGYTHNPVKISGFDSMRASVTSLSLNRFVNGSYLSFINAHSVKTDDCMVFYLGEIDFRHSIHKYCSDKSKDLVQTCLDLMNDYYKVIKNIKKIYNNRIIIMAPNPPMRDNYLVSDLVLGTEEERILCWDIFDNFWKNKDVEYLDWTNDYRSEDTLIDINKLMKRNGADFHILDYQYCINSLSKKLNNNKEIIIKLIGGMGNQMFQYSFGRALSLKYNRPLKLDLSFLKNRNMGSNFVYRDYDLDIYNVFEDFEFTSDDISIVSEQILTYDQNIIDHISSNFDRKIMIDGYWGTYKYFLDYESQIRKDFEFKDKIEDNIDIKIIEMYNKINNNNSVMINVRRTDFLNNNFHGVMGVEYINKAVDIIKSKVDNPHYFIFSDDIDWCEKNIKLDNMTIVDHYYKGNKFGYYLQLMKSCKHFIIPNSTFAWWAAWLNENPNKVVISPKKWINVENNNTKDLIPKNWISI